MLRNVILVLCALLAADPVLAASPALRQQMMQPPGWVLPNIGMGAADYDFKNGRYYVRGAGLVPPGITVSRTSAGTAVDAYGNWWQQISSASCPSNQNGLCAQRTTNLGITVEEARTNSALWSRDLTNAAWTKTNITAALNATGIFNDANTASTLTATAGNGTVLQSVTLATGNSYSVFVKRLTGSGEIDITGNGGTGWTNIASSINSATFTRVSIVNQAVTNPSIGFRIVTNGDAIIVDVHDLELGSFVTTPIVTTNAAVQRNADAVTMTLPPVFQKAYGLVSCGTPEAPSAYGTNQRITTISDGSGANFLAAYKGSGGATVFIQNNSGGTATTFGSATWAQSTLGKVSGSTTAGAQVGAFNGSANGTGAGSLPVGVNTVGFGNNTVGGAIWNGTISRITVIPTIAPVAAQLQAYTNAQACN